MDSISDNPSWTVAVQGGVRIEALDAWSHAVAAAVLPELCRPADARSQAVGVDVNIVFVPSPARAVREALRAGIDAAQARSRWIASVDALLAARQIAPEGSLLFDAEEACDSVASVREAVSARLGLALPAPAAAPAPVEDDDTLLTLVRQLVRHDAVLAELQDQLLAMCQPVLANDASVASQAAPPPDAWQAIDTLVRRAEEGQRALEKQQVSLDALLSLRDEALARVQMLLTQVDEVADERDALIERLSAAEARLHDLEAAMASGQAAQQVAQKDAEIARLELERENVSMAQALQRRDLALQDEVAQSAALRAALDEAQTLAASAQAQAGQSAQRVAELEAELGRTRRVITEIEADLEAARERFEGQRVHCADQAAAFERDAEAARQVHADMSARLAASIQDARRLQQTAEEAEEASRHARAESAALQQALESVRATAAADAQLARLQVDQVLEEVSQLAQARERLQAQWAASLEQVAALEARLETHAAQADVAQDEQDRSLRQELALSKLQLAQAQEELREATREREARLAGVQRQYERTSDQLRDALGLLAEQVGGGAGGGGDALTAFVGLDVLHEHDEPPHRGLTVALQPDDPALPELLVRLVDHQGHAGLVFFTGSDGRAPLTQWRRSGTEGGHDYMILLPDDRGPSNPFRPMASRDWRLVREVTHQFVRALPDEFVDRWRPTAVRVLRALEALPPQLRYAALEVCEGGSGRVLRFTDVIHGTREWPTLEMRLLPKGGFAWVLPDTGLPPFAGWPLDTEGRPAPWQPLPLTDAAAAQAWLDQLSPIEREFQTAALAALDSLFDHPQAGPELQAALRQARDTLQRARKRSRMRRVVRRLLSRGA